ncbi:mitochondrial import receptor subunit TOM20 homolog [Panonychus citri]|uniref:mitochondrial import receptor subunit TOM20 homolog n=1 Tax=Panonychus citri TaxID=50023 RepID=UPI00230791D1|nr:mitochondrial import receptor subunit TOM20 homolog [Panonychus citri]
MSWMSFRVAAGVAGGLFIAYCVYFDHKRRCDPMFRQKLRERRAAARKKEESSFSSTDFPDLRDQDAVQKFFIQEIQLGEELLGLGDMEGGVEHLTNAVSVCAQPNQLLQVLNQTLPPQIFQGIIARLPIICQKTAAAAATAASANSSTVMVEDDVE